MRSVVGMSSITRDVDDLVEGDCTYFPEILDAARQLNAQGRSIAIITERQFT